MKEIDNIKKFIKEFRQYWKVFFLSFSLSLIIICCIGFWFIFTALSVKDFAPKDIPILDYITIALTLFGFTLVGGIFEKKDPNKLPLIARNLFRDSLLFLSSGSSFLLAYSIIPHINSNSWKILFQFTYIVGALIFAIAIWRLLMDLVYFFWDISEKT